MDTRAPVTKSLDVDFLSEYFTIRERVERPRETGVEYDTDVLRLVGAPVRPDGKSFQEQAYRFYMKQRKPTTVRVYDFVPYDAKRPAVKVHESHRVIAIYAVNIK